MGKVGFLVVHGGASRERGEGNGEKGGGEDQRETRIHIQKLK